MNKTIFLLSLLIVKNGLAQNVKRDTDVIENIKIKYSLSQDVRRDTIENDFAHYNRYVGKVLVFMSNGNNFKGENVFTNQIFKAGNNDWPEFGERTTLYKAQNSPFTLSDSLYNKEFFCLGAKSDGVSVDLKLDSKTTGIFVCEFSISYCPLQTPEEIKKIKTDDLAQKVKEQKENTELQKEIDNPCTRIDYSYDEFHYTKKYNTATDLPKKIADTSYYKDFTAVFYKDIVRSIPTYYLSLNTITSRADITRRGVIIILKNGKRINKPMEKVSTTVENVHDETVFMVKSFILLTQNDIALLKSSPLDEFELYVDQDSVPHSDIIYQMFLCLLNKK